MKNSPKKILIIDDETRIRNIYIALFNESGLETREAANANEALNVLIRESVDLVLLDICIPAIDGKTIFEIIKEYDPNLKIIVASVYPLHAQKQMIPDAFDYYDKSHGPIALLNKVLSHMEHLATP